MKVRRIPRTPPKRPASKTTLSRGEACPDPSWADGEGVVVLVQSSRANTNAAKSTSCVSSSRRSRVVVPGLKDVVQGSTRATSSRPRVSDSSSFSCLPDEPRKIRGLSICSSWRGPQRGDWWLESDRTSSRGACWAAGTPSLLLARPGSIRSQANLAACRLREPGRRVRLAAKRGAESPRRSAHARLRVLLPEVQQAVHGAHEHGGA